MPDTPNRSLAVVLPVRSFSGAKQRLATTLDDDARSALARAMADVVADAAQATVGRAATMVVTSDPGVVAWAERRGLVVASDPGQGLDGAAAAGLDAARAGGFDRVAVVHADLPLVDRLDVLGRHDAEVVVFTDRHRDGTNALVVPTDAPFAFAYGPGSAARHRAAAEAAGRSVTVVTDEHLGWDVDDAADLEHPSLAALLAGLEAVAR